MRLLRWYVARRILRLVQEGQAVDIGCGPGHLVFKLAQMAPSLKLTGIDLSEEVLAQAEAFAHQNNLDNLVNFKKGSAQAIPFPDNSLDLVISTLSLHHWGEPVSVLNEVSRVLRPGGSFLIFDLRRDMSALFYILLWIATKFIVPQALRHVNEPMASRNAAYSVQEARQLATSANLTGWRIDFGPLWLILEGKSTIPEKGVAN
jgi:ubiquinone/menaquinone biosynthesis C-methylase UbiE